MAKAEKNVRLEKASKSSGSDATEEAKRDQAIQELGQQLIKELDDRDITAKWMAAYLAELIVSAKKDVTLEQECHDLILTLWRERSHYPGGDPMQRYARALEAIELLLSTGDPVFQVLMPHRTPKVPDRDQISIARKLKHHSSFLTSRLVRLVVEELGLDKDGLAEIADIADPNEETRFLNVLRIVIHDKEKGEDEDDARSEIREAISNLRGVLDDLEVALQPPVTDPKLMN